jgi:hypothetical protein
MRSRGMTVRQLPGSRAHRAEPERCGVVVIARMRQWNSVATERYGNAHDARSLLAVVRFVLQVASDEYFSS